MPPPRESGKPRGTLTVCGSSVGRGNQTGTSRPVHSPPVVKGQLVAGGSFPLGFPDLPLAHHGAPPLKHPRGGEDRRQITQRYRSIFGE